jgi:hypothetical protein
MEAYLKIKLTSVLVEDQNKALKFSQPTEPKLSRAPLTSADDISTLLGVSRVLVSE